MQKAALALFDFDNTIAHGDSIVPFLLYAIRKGKAPLMQLPRAIATYIRHLRHPDGAAQAKSVTLSFIAGYTQTEMDELARSFFHEVLLRRVYADARQELERLHSEGYHIVVVSASAELYMRVLPEFLPVDALLATRCSIDSEGRYTGLIGDNCKGLQKPLRIAEYLAAKHMEIDTARSRAYGDSPSDEPMLRLAGTPVLVNPKKKLRAAIPDSAVVHWR